MEATVVMAKCKVSKKSFGIRAEKLKKSWIFTWAFNLSDKAAKNEGYDQAKISGTINLNSEYPGCPHCAAKSFFQCGGCNKIVCYAGKEEKITCPHCGIICEGFVETDDFNGISGGAF